MGQSESLSDVEALIGLLRRSTLRTRTGVWRVPLRYVGQEPDVAVRLGIEAIDVRETIVQRLPAATRYIRLTPEKMLEALDYIACHPGRTDCALVYNVDLLLAGLSRDGRQQVWESLFDGLPHRGRALLVSMPESAMNLLPAERLLEAWQRDQRLV